MKNKRPGIIFLIVVFALLILGITMVYSSSYPYAIKFAERFKNDPNYFGKRQLIFCLIGIVAMFLAYITPIKVYKKMGWATYFGSVALCVLAFTLFKSKSINEVNRWISVGGFTIQPSDFLKLGVALYLPAILCRKKMPYRPVIVAGLLGLSAFVVYKQQDLGTVIVIAGVIMILYFLTHMSFSEAILYFVGGSVFLYMSIAGTEYRKNRCYAFLDPFSDKLNTGWHAIQSMYAVANGGFGGVGIGASIQKHGYVYAAYSDYIFSILSEELGMFGGMMVIIAILFIAITPLRFVGKLDDEYSRLVLIAFSLFVIIQSFIHIAVVLNAIPAKGITLPFISYGGSSILTYCTFVGVAFNIMRKGKLKEQK